MKKLILSLLVASWRWCRRRRMRPKAAIPWDKFPTEKLTDLAALQNGAKLFVNYCLNCHSAAFMRYNRLRDIGLTEEQIKKNLLFATDKVGDTMKAAIDPKQAKDWFGATPPDLSRDRALARRAIGRAPAPTTSTPTCAPSTATTPRPTGWNNLAFPNVAHAARAVGTAGRAPRRRSPR